MSSQILMTICLMVVIYFNVQTSATIELGSCTCSACTCEHAASPLHPGPNEIPVPAGSTCQCPNVTTLTDEVKDLKGKCSDLTTLTDDVKDLKGKGSDLTKLTHEVQELKAQVNKKPQAQVVQPFPYNGYRYKLTRLARNWHSSRAYCREIGGDLAVFGIKKYRQRKLISSYLELDYTSQVWIGAYDYHNEGAWRWADGSAMNSATAMWNPGEPNNSNRKGGEDCATMVPGSYDRLNDAHCTASLLAICEMKIPQ